MSIWDTIKSFFSEPLGRDSIASEVENPLVKVLHPLDVLRHEALKEESQVEDHQAAHQSEEEKQALLEHQEALLQDILSLHNRLSTGLSLDALRPMVDALRKHCQDYRTYRSDELDDLAMLAVMDDLHRRALEWAWTDFATRLTNAGLPWPDPTGVSPNATPDEIEKHREHHVAEMRENFVSGHFRRFPDLMIGVVPAWRHLYPEQGGSVWTSAVYESVAAALACRRLHQIELVAEREKENIERLVATTLEEPLKPVQEQLAAGVRSIHEARRLSDQAVDICQRVAPQIVWEHIQEKF